MKDPWRCFYVGPMRRHLYAVYLIDEADRMECVRVKAWCRLDVKRIIKEQFPDRLIYCIQFIR